MYPLSMFSKDRDKHNLFMNFMILTLHLNAS